MVENINIPNIQATPESVWAEIQKNRPVPKIVSEEEAQFNRKMKKMESCRYYLHNDGFYYSDGFYAEEYFLTVFRYGKKTFFGEKFDDIENHLKARKDTYDLVMFNDFAVAILELVYTASEKNVLEVLKKAETFRVDFPQYENHKIYLGLATMEFYPELEEKCINEGIAVIKQVGDSVVINDTNLKVF